jgi:hypothetical protein
MRFRELFEISFSILIKPARLGEAFREAGATGSSLVLTGPTLVALFAWCGFSSAPPARDWLLVELAGVLVALSIFAGLFHLNARIFNPDSSAALASMFALVFFVFSVLALYLYLPLSICGNVVSNPSTLVNYKTILYYTVALLYFVVCILSLGELHRISIARSVGAVLLSFTYVGFFAFSCYYLNRVMSVKS